MFKCSSVFHHWPNIALQRQSAVTTYFVKIEFRVKMCFITPSLSWDKNSWSNCVPFQRYPQVKFAVTTKSNLIPRLNAVSEVTAFCLCSPGFDTVDTAVCLISPIRIYWGKLMVELALKRKYPDNGKDDGKISTTDLNLLSHFSQPAPLKPVASFHSGTAVIVKLRSRRCFVSCLHFWNYFSFGAANPTDVKITKSAYSFS